MDDREGGFIVVHRRLRSSRLYRSLTGEQRVVFYTVLLLANWKPDAIVAGKWHAVQRGELAHSLETIAGESGVSVKVVRSTLAKMFADDRSVGGRGPFLSERYVGTEEGTPRRVLTIVRYDEYQSLGHDTGTAQGTTGARPGHDTGTTGAPREPDEPDEPVKRCAPAAPANSRRNGLVSPGEAMARPYAVALHDLLAETWPGITYAPGAPAIALNAACQERGGTAAFAVQCREFAQRKGVEPVSTAWFASCLKDIGKPPPVAAGKRPGMALVDTDWTSEKATRF
jgi:hypothetical protein